MNLSLSESQIHTAPKSDHLAGWPSEVLPMFERAITTEYASLTKRGSPLTYPVTPYLGENGHTLDISTGLTYPSKAERARHNPKVALLFSDKVGTNLEKPPVVLVQGLAAVRDANLQANTDRYLRMGFKKLPEAYEGMPAFILRRMPWYFVRIWVQVTPLQIRWWPEGDLDRQPEYWEAPKDIQTPESDPKPAGKAPGSWKSGPSDWRPGANFAIQNLGNPILTLIDKQGFPLPMRVRSATVTPNGFQLERYDGLPAYHLGAACLTFHTHPEKFTGQQNMVFTGNYEEDGTFTVDKQIGDWSLSGSKLTATWSFMSNGRKLAPRLAEEAKRRGQAVPVINIPHK